MSFKRGSTPNPLLLPSIHESIRKKFKSSTVSWDEKLSHLQLSPQKRRLAIFKHFIPISFHLIFIFLFRWVIFLQLALFLWMKRTADRKNCETATFVIIFHTLRSHREGAAALTRRSEAFSRLNWSLKKTFWDVLFPVRVCLLSPVTASLAERLVGDKFLHFVFEHLVHLLRALHTHSMTSVWRGDAFGAAYTHINQRNRSNFRPRKQDQHPEWFWAGDIRSKALDVKNYKWCRATVVFTHKNINFPRRRRRLLPSPIFDLRGCCVKKCKLVIRVYVHSKCVRRRQRYKALSKGGRLGKI
jgi:hypothetical protein